jgi:adenylosuccinate synthase
MQDLLEFPHLMLHAADLTDGAKVRRNLLAIRDLKLEQLAREIAAVCDHPLARLSCDTLLDYTWIDTAVAKYGTVGRLASILRGSASSRILKRPGASIFEGAQGVLLDERFGFHPYTTWSRTTFANALALLDEAGFEGRVTRVGIARTYFTRHGPGPFVTEDESLRNVLLENHNDDSGWQGRFRVGVFDAVAARYAIDAADGIDVLAMTHFDALPRLPRRICTGYELVDETADGLTASSYFRMTANRISHIRKRVHADVAYQEWVTQRLGRCRPVYRELPDRASETFLQAMHNELKTRVGIVSSGPMPWQKQILLPVAFQS